MERFGRRRGEEPVQKGVRKRKSVRDAHELLRHVLAHLSRAKRRQLDRVVVAVGVSSLSQLHRGHDQRGVQFRVELAVDHRIVRRESFERRFVLRRRGNLRRLCGVFVAPGTVRNRGRRDVRRRRRRARARAPRAEPETSGEAEDAARAVVPGIKRIAKIRREREKSLPRRAPRLRFFVTNGV